MIYIEHSGGFRMVRDRMDRADIVISVRHEDRKHAVDLAYRCRAALLEELPGRVVAGAEVLDVEEISSPAMSPTAPVVSTCTAARSPCSTSLPDSPLPGTVCPASVFPEEPYAQ
ncbi:hypothetical protein ACFQ2B_26120 [Streptomyces stramineus]